MEQFNQFVQRSHGAASSLMLSVNLQVLLLIGSGVLAISLLVLALTKWGHSRPVWKCVILSFAAHILLMGYAYATYLFLDQPVAVIVANPLQVNLVEDDGESLVSISDSAGNSKRAKQPWEKLADQTIPAPEVDPLDRPLIDSELVIEREPAPEDASTLAADLSQHQPPLASLPEANPSDFDLEAALRPDPRSRTSPLDLKPEMAPPIEAQPIKVARRGDSQESMPKDAPWLDDEDPLELERQNLDSPTDSVLTKNAIKLNADRAKDSLFRPLSNARFAAEQSMPAQLASVATKLSPGHSLNAGTSSGRLRVIKSSRRLGDGQKMPDIYSLRSSTNRLEIAKRRGGSVLTERAVENALKWMSEQQQPDGRWDPQDSGAGRETKTFGHNRNGAGAKADTGITALATLAFLAGGHSHFEGPYQQNVQRALEYLASQQATNGNLAGSAKLFARMYCHSMSLLALSEALAMTGDQRLLPVVQRGVDYCVEAQNRNDGGWRYQPGDGGDMSQFGWMVMALRSARLGGAVVPSKTRAGMHGFLDRCSSGVGKSLASYRPGQGVSTAMTAEALLCRYLLDEVPSEQGLDIASRRISEEQPSTRKANFYYWYYGTLAMRHVGGDAWDQWNARLKSALVSLQQTKGQNAGSWEPEGLWGGYGGRVYSTSMATLNLEVYYRYLPSHEME